MKKIISFILAALMVSSLTVGAEDVKGAPNTFFALTYIGTHDHDNIIKPVNVNATMVTEKGVVAVAKDVKNRIEKLPEGRRAIDITNLVNKYFTSGRENYFFAGENVTNTKEFVDALFAQFKKEGVPIDFIIDDNESAYTPYQFENSAIYHFREGGEDVFDSIDKNGHLYEDYIKDMLIDFANHPTYEEQLRPRLAENGFVFGEEYDLLYINIFPNAQEPRRTKFFESNPPEGAEDAITIFSEALHELFVEHYNEGVTEPIKKYYPNVKMSNYDTSAKTGGYDAFTGWGEKRRVSLANDVNIIGTHSSPVIYGRYATIRQNVPKGYPYDVYRSTAFNVMLLEKQLLDSVLMAQEGTGQGMMPWIGSKSWVEWISPESENNGVYHNFAETDYYQEMVFHIGMTNPDPLLIFDTNVSGKNSGGGVTEDMALVSKILNQLDELAGFEDREAIVPLRKNATTIDQRYLLSGISAGGRNVWRITPDLYTPGVSIENFKVSDSPLKFQIGNQIVEFPNGSYVYEPEEKLSDYGYWVISPKGTRPNEYRDANIALPDEPVETEDCIPTGYMLEATGTGKASDLYENSGTDTEDKNGEDTENTEDVEIDTVSLAISPIDFTGKKLTLVTEALPADIRGHWAEDTVANLFALGILKGTDQGMLPDSNVKMSELVTMLMRILGVSVETYDNSISGLSEEAWYKNEIFTALKGGWIEADDIAVADTPVTREKSVLIFYNAVKSLLKEGEGVSFADEYRIAQSAREAVAKISAAGLISGYPDGEFKPKNMITRAEAAVIIENFLVYIR